jgi:hypothetical protein
VYVGLRFAFIDHSSSCRGLFLNVFVFMYDELVVKDSFTDIVMMRIEIQ